MQNIPLLAALEGTQQSAKTDWFAIMAMLKLREVSDVEIQNVYNELCAGLKVTTRGVTIYKQSEEMINQ